MLIRGHGGIRMQHHERLREHASRLLVLAQKARDEGRHEFASELARLAADAFDQAFAMEGRDNQSDSTP